MTSPSLAGYLADPTLVGVKLVRVSVELFVNSARPGHDLKTVQVCAPRPVFGVFFESTSYTVSVASGHELNPEGLRNRIDIRQTNRKNAPVWSKLAFTMVPDGKEFLSADGRSFVLAIGGSGEDVVAYVDPLVLGDPPVSRTPADPHRWVGSAFRSVDVNLIDDVPMKLTSRQGPKRGAFRRG